MGDGPVPAIDEGVLDPDAAAWLEANPQSLDWIKEGFPPEILELARTFEGMPPTRHIDHVDDEVVDGVRVRIYRNDATPTALIVYFHGGAFVIGSIAIMDGVARELTHATGAVVVSVEYGLAPESPYPAGVNDCVTVTSWALQNASRFGLSAESVVVAGESAGGNLATVVPMKLRDDGAPQVAGQILVYPATDGTDATYPSRDQFGHADWVLEMYGGGRDISQEPYAVPMRAKTLAGLPPALVLVGGCDPLRDEGRAYAQRLRADGV